MLLVVQGAGATAMGVGGAEGLDDGEVAMGVMGFGDGISQKWII